MPTVLATTLGLRGSPASTLLGGPDSTSSGLGLGALEKHVLFDGLHGISKGVGTMKHETIFKPVPVLRPRAHVHVGRHLLELLAVEPRSCLHMDTRASSGMDIVLMIQILHGIIYTILP